MRQLVPDLGAVETAVDDIIDFLFGSNYAVEHDVRARELVVASDSMKHALSTLMEGIELNPKAICILPSFLRLGDDFKSNVVVVQSKVIVAFALLVHLLGYVQLEVFLYVSESNQKVFAVREELMETVDDLMVRIHFWFGGDWLETAVVGLAHSMLWSCFDFLLSEFGGAGFDVGLLEVILSFGGTQIFADDVVIDWFC